ncbi:acyl-CoA desaturase [Actinoalloteichus hymeniacidonis]|uniref:Fatty-acid desaturase n=1 Tax=Actinoalloteichus hymeniacidonis TaxID=340345 RepID=A0AAC9MWV9_9PSEU|nr:acyl-CoA desaturase [Actinoalloteichus hymeniacidonis]AOS61574.1 fatty-acid desaturase [Actinoalloteichus hymeniacidonis]MBB5910416.1 stearoyl-CoA desaturase (delta-9 desaturase) [Actinoalloteichus hymeniacidonis]
MTSTLDATPSAESGRSPKPVILGRRRDAAQIGVYVFVILPFLALIAAVPFAWGWGLSWLDIGLGAIFFVFSGLGITAGFHRYFTHGSFKANRPLRVGLAIAGSMALQGPVITWVADHRRHHAFSDKEGDPHSPWMFGTSPAALAKGFWHAHTGWLFERDLTNSQRFAPDLLADPDIARVQRQFGLWTVVSLVLPGVLGGLISWSIWGGITAFFWAGLVRVGLLHHVTWSVNSICHMVGERPFQARDKSANFWPLAILSFGESWHNLHHADPTCARHGVQRGQIDITARLIWMFEKFGWATKVRWPTTQRLARISANEE